MTTRLTHVCVDANDPAALSRFWSEALGWKIWVENPHEVAIASADERDVPLVFVPVPELKAVKNRVHLDLATSTKEHQAATVERLLALGATHANIGQGDVGWVVLADLEGNEFCVLEPGGLLEETGPVAAICLDAADPKTMGEFWRAATGWPQVMKGDWGVALRGPGGRGPFLTMGPKVAPKPKKNRLHIDVRPYAADDHAAEVSRLVQLGAKRVDIGQGDVPWVVLADPEGNELCVLTPRD